MNKLFYGDNLDILRDRSKIKDESVDLCYIDPPFNSKRNYNQIYNNLGREDRAQVQAFVDTWTWDTRAEEGFATIPTNPNGVLTKQAINLILGLEKVLGKGSLLAYLVSMTLRIAEIRRVLKPTGSFYLHCDPTASHYLKLVLDAIFCGQGGEFQNEIIWAFKSGGATNKRFSRKHQNIFFYSKSKKFKFNAVKEKSYMKPWSGKNPKQSYHKDDEGSFTLVYTKDWWQDIGMLSTDAKERLGYPTQKPDLLLERIISASSKEGDLVLDAYCGCGTSVAVAERLKRQWIGIDITYQSIALILKRLEDHFGKEIIDTVALDGVPRDMESAVALAHKKDDRVRKEFEKWAVLTYSKNRAVINEKKGGDKGIDGVSFVGEADGVREVYFSVKSNENLTPSVIRDLHGTMTRDGAVMGYLLTLYPMPNLVKESKQYGMYKNEQFGREFPKIQVVSVQDILKGERMNLPIAMTVLRDAELKYLSKQSSFDLETDLP